MSPNHTEYVIHIISAAQTKSVSVFVLVSFLTLICSVGVALHIGALILYITDSYADLKPTILMALSVVEAIDCFRYALSGWHYIYENQFLMKVVYFFAFIRAFYFEIIVLLAVETWIKLKLDIHYDIFKMNRIYTRVIPILFVLTFTFTFVFRLRSRFKKSPKVFLICINILISVFIILTWMYMLIRTKRTHIPPVKYIVRKSRSSRNKDDAEDKVVATHKLETTEKCRIGISSLKKVADRYKWAFSVPALILITHIPFVFIPSVVRFATVNNFSILNKEILAITNSIGHICDAMIQFYCTKRVMRRIKRIFMTRKL